MRVELGCPGHLIVSASCRWRRHTQVGDYRVSTLGDYYPARDKERATIGAGDDAFFETMVFPLTPRPVDDNEGCGCREVASYSELECERYATAGAAQAGHEAMVAKYEALAAAEVEPAPRDPLRGTPSAHFPEGEPAPETPAAKAVDTARLYSTTDAMVWAEEFAKVHPEIDPGLMLGWFANCAENAKDHLRHADRTARPAPEVGAMPDGSPLSGDASKFYSIAALIRAGDTAERALQKHGLALSERPEAAAVPEAREHGFVWSCKIGGHVDALPEGADGPLRQAVEQAFRDLTGRDASFTFSGWGDGLDAREIDCINGKPQPSGEGQSEPTTAQKIATLLDPNLDIFRGVSR